MSLAVNLLSRNPNEDRVIPRFSRYLRDHLGWALTARPTPGADAFYLSGYFENGLIRQTPNAARKPVAAYFTHLEEHPANNAKAKLFHQVAASVDLRIVTAAQYGTLLSQYGPTVQILPPVERDRFTIPPSRGKLGSRPLVAGFSGFTYPNGRKGEKLARILISNLQSPISWKAAGRGWPVPTQNYPWHALPAFYQSLDILVCTATVEGVPMPPLEALACGVSVVIPRGVGLLDELGEAVGVHRYEKGNPDDLTRAFHEACQARSTVDPRALRWLTEPFTVDSWCLGHQAAFEEYFVSNSITYPTRSEGLTRPPTPLPMPPSSLRLEGSDDEILKDIRGKWREVDTILSWTRKKIPYLKRQIAPYQGALLAYFAHLYDRPGAQFLEIGTAIGYSACLMATAAPRAHITTLNPKDGEFEQAVKNLRIRGNVRVVKETSQVFLKDLEKNLTPSPSPTSGEGDRRGEYDLIFVDGDHAYNMVLHDAQFFNYLRPGGLILFHDYSPTGSARPSDGSFRALNDLAERHRPFDVLVIGTGGVGMAGWMRQEEETW